MPHVVQSLAEVGRHFGRCRRTAQRWRRAGLPRLSSGAYDLDEIGGWLKTTKGLGATFRQMESDEQVTILFERAVMELRRGLQHLCESFVKARGRTRATLIHRALRGILQDTMKQVSLLDGGGKAAGPGRPRPPVQGNP